MRFTVECDTSFCSERPWTSLPAPRVVVITRRSLRTLVMSACVMLWRKVSVPRMEPAQRVVEPRRYADQLAGVALSRSGPRKRAVRWKLPSLLRMRGIRRKARFNRKCAVIGDFACLL